MKLKTDAIQALLNTYHSKSNTNYPSTIEDFERNAKRYIKAIKSGRMMCNIESVSASGMSRKLRFFEMDRSKVNGQHYIYNFYTLFQMLGYSPVGDSDCFTIRGCGMDMVFDTNYNIIHELHSLGFINKTPCAKLAQQTPHVI